MRVPAILQWRWAPAIGLVGGAVINCLLLVVLVPETIAVPGQRAGAKDPLARSGSVTGVALGADDDSPTDGVAPSRPGTPAPRAPTRNPFALGGPAPSPSPVVTTPPPSPPTPAPPPPLTAPAVASPPPAPPPPPPAAAPEGTIPGVHIVRRAPILQPPPVEKAEEPAEAPPAEAPPTPAGDEAQPAEPPPAD
ncbi:MAG: hypothetical protein IT376_21005 [Polyangiaceae bacterium]|nr:hypothetical protein [Polyangiaceae bacterium]